MNRKLKDPYVYNGLSMVDKPTTLFTRNIYYQIVTPAMIKAGNENNKKGEK